MNKKSPVKIEFERIKLENIVRIGKFFTRSVSLKKSLKENQDILYNYFSKNLEDFFSMFSLRVWYDLSEMLKTPSLRLDMKKIGDEDIIDLFEAGIINSAGNILPKYKTLFKKAIKNIPNFDDIAIMNTLIKGMVDIYGCIDLESIYDLFKEVLEINMTLQRFVHILKHDSRVRLHAIYHDGYLLRFEAVNIYKMKGCISEVELDDLSYKKFDVKQYLRFADTFDITGEFPYSDNQYYTLKVIKRFNLAFDFKKDKFLIDALGIDDETIKSMSDYDKGYPKWIFKGYNLPEYEKYMYQDRFNISDTPIYDC